MRPTNARKQLTRRTLIRHGAIGLAGMFAIPRCAAVSAEPCVETVTGHDALSYHLVAFDKDGRERPWSDSRTCSSKAIEVLRQGKVTDVFIFSHGWMGDVEQAKIQYNNWVSAMADCQSDIAKMREVRRDFSPLLIGIHWPSLPLGDETLQAFGAINTALGADKQIGKYAENIANTRRARRAIETIILSANEPTTNELPNQLAEEFRILVSEARLRTDGAGARPGFDGADFDPKVLYADILTDPEVQSSIPKSGATGARNYNLLYLLALVSFWKMKERASLIGETGGRKLLRDLQTAARPDVNFHLMGHSFGCVVMSAVIQGAANDNRSIRPVNSLCLVQGALSHWAYCSNVYNTGKPGHFRPMFDRRLVSGPIITTQSEHDTAVKTLYPYAAWFKKQRFMADRNTPEWEKKEYGAIGFYGIQGENCNPVNVDILDVNGSYGFQPGATYNINSSRVINAMSPISGAHSDIYKPEVAHAIWEAAMVQASRPTPIPQPIPNPQPNPAPLPAPNRPGIIKRLLRRR